MFAVTSADSNSGGLSLKCPPDSFAEMTERPGVEPAAYVGRYGWIHVKALDTVPEGELKTLIERSYQLVFDKLPSKVKKSLS
jgi:predicted DNA-binding protein (MmcQ/YjbR family)